MERFCKSVNKKKEDTAENNKSPCSNQVAIKLGRALGKSFLWMICFPILSITGFIRILG